MLPQQKTIMVSSDDDDDDELPSLAERIKASVTLQNQNTSHHVSSDSEDEDSSFLKFSEIIRNTPCPQVKFNQNQVPDKKIEEPKVLQNGEKNNPAPLNIKLDFSLTSESEDEESQFLNFSQKIQSTSEKKVFAPQSSLGACIIMSESDSDDEVFSNLTERLKMSTPRIENKENNDTAIRSAVAKKISDFRTPLPPGKKDFSTAVVDSESDESFSNFIETLRTPLSVNRKEFYKTVDSESDGSFTTFIQTLKTPMSVNRNIPHKATDSESDGSFSSFVERLKTPLSVNRNILHKATDSESDGSFSSFVERLKTPLSVNRKTQHKVTESDSDDSFLNISRKPPFQTPKSQKKNPTDVVALPKVTEIKSCRSALVVEENTSNSAKVSMSTENEKEFRTLFDPERIDSIFLLKRKSYTHKLYEFFNKKVFNSRLPADMPLFYDGALKTTAGLTCCRVKKGIYVCSIKLCPSLLISFDRLKETLLHEMCHAAVWILNNRDVQHGPLWQIWASRCKLILPFIECPTRCHNYEIAYRVWYQCSKCPWKRGSCKQLKKYHGAVCKRCRSPIIMIRS